MAASGTQSRVRRALRGRGRMVALAALVVVVIAAAVGFAERHAIENALSGYNAAGGDPATVALKLPPGFRASVYAAGLHAPRFFTFGPDGTLYVADSQSGRIVAFFDPGRTGKATRSVTVASGLNDPTSVVYESGTLLVGEQSQVTRLTLGAGDTATARSVVVPNLPVGGQHTTRTVLVGSDGSIYVAIGSTCNVCVESDPHRAAVWVYQQDGSGGRLYAKGLRNAVGLAVNPWNAQIWATDNGRDYLGDNLPPETVYALRDGGNYGWPSCQAGTIVDPDFGHAGSCDGVVAPLVEFQAHMAPLGLAFYRDGPFPAAYHGLFVAFHGSWNRSTPVGYKVMFVPLNAQGQVAGAPRDFATGWLHADNTAPGRPVGVGVGPDGALYVSDDKAGVIYRISYGG